MIIKINNAELARAHGKKPGDTVTVADKDGVVLDRYWRNRLKDAETDKAVSVVKENAPVPTPPVPTPQKSTKSDKETK